MKYCRFCGWIGTRGGYDPLEMDETGCPSCLSGHEALQDFTREISALFGWRVAYLRYKARRNA